MVLELFPFTVHRSNTQVPEIHRSQLVKCFLLSCLKRLALFPGLYGNTIHSSDPKCVQVGSFFLRFCQDADLLAFVLQKPLFLLPTSVSNIVFISASHQETEDVDSGSY